MSRMHNPSHPGAILADTVLRKGGGISVTEFAKALNVSRWQRDDFSLLKLATGPAPRDSPAGATPTKMVPAWAMHGT